jgi:hypothetical protein
MDFRVAAEKDVHAFLRTTFTGLTAAVRAIFAYVRFGDLEEVRLKLGNLHIYYNLQVLGILLVFILDSYCKFSVDL